MYVAIIFVVSIFSWDIRNMNLDLLSIILRKLGKNFSIFSYISILSSLYLLQSIRKCISSSNLLQNKHNLPALLILGLYFLPSSIINLWSDNLNLVRVLIYLISFMCFRYSSILGFSLNSLYVSDLDEILILLLHSF